MGKSQVMSHVEGAHALRSLHRHYRRSDLPHHFGGVDLVFGEWNVSLVRNERRGTCTTSTIPCAYCRILHLLTCPSIFQWPWPKSLEYPGTSSDWTTDRLRNSAKNLQVHNQTRSQQLERNSFETSGISGFTIRVHTRVLLDDL